jgi:hypothetical protein
LSCGMRGQSGNPRRNECRGWSVISSVPARRWRCLRRVRERSPTFSASCSRMCLDVIHVAISCSSLSHREPKFVLSIASVGPAPFRYRARPYDASVTLVTREFPQQRFPTRSGFRGERASPATCVSA